VAGGIQNIMNQKTGISMAAIKEMWDDMELCDDDLLAWLNGTTAVGDLDETGGVTLDGPSATASEPYFALPTWANPNYAAAVVREIINPETTWRIPQNSLDWLPRDIAFVVNEGVPRYLYEIPLREWMMQYMGDGPQTQDLKYWEINSTFLHVNTKNQRGRADPTIEDIHAISLFGVRVNSMELMDRGVKNNIGISEMTASPENLRGEFLLESPPQVIYSFWDRTHTWPMEIPIPNGTDNMGNNRGQKSQQVSKLHSMLTPTDDDSEWWNLFLNAENGILSMTATDLTPEVWSGWRMAWNYCYMEDVIWRKRILKESIGNNPEDDPDWTDDLTLENFCEKVYPSEPINVAYTPKAIPRPESIGDWATMSFIQQAEQIAASMDTNTPFNNSINPNALYLHNLTYQSTNSSLPSYISSTNKLPRLNIAPVGDAFGGLGNQSIQSPTNKAAYAAIVRNYMAWTSIQGRQNEAKVMSDYTENNEWNVSSYPVNAFALVQGRQIQNGDYPFMNNNIQFPEGAGTHAVLMEDDAANIAILPNIQKMETVGDAQDWTTIRENTGYNRGGWGWGGSLIDFLYSANNGTSPELDFNTVQKIIISDLPTDVYQMETYTAFSSRNIDYTAPSGSPWRRGKIPMINWSAILSPKLLTMLTSEE
jgi:hypothetical protein